MFLRFNPFAIRAALSGKRNPSARDFVDFSDRGTMDEGPTFVGTAEQVADQMEAWFAGVCDGFVLYGTTIPGTTLRDTLGLAAPAARA